MCFGTSRIHVFDNNIQQFMALEYDFAQDNAVREVIRMPKLYKQSNNWEEPERDSKSDSDFELIETEQDGVQKEQLNISDLQEQEQVKRRETKEMTIEEQLLMRLGHVQNKNFT